MFRDRLRDRFGLSFVARVMAAHDALKFAELDHHFAYQICLAQPSGSRRSYLISI